MRKRKTSADGYPGAARIAAFTAAPSSAQTLKNLPAAMRSARLRTAATAVPQTKPNWTIVVSQPASDVVRPQINRSCGVTALAENHKDMPNNSAKPSNASTRQRVEYVSADIVKNYSRPGATSMLRGTSTTRPFGMHQHCFSHCARL